MGLSLSVVLAVCLLLPGAAFVFGLSRLHDPNLPGTSLDPHLSASLALAVGSAMLFQGMWLLIWRWVMHRLAWPEPDAAQVIALLGGGLSPRMADQALLSVSLYPIRICVYFITLPMLALGIGRWSNRYLRRRPMANWLDLLRPANVLFVWMTADVHLDGRCYLYAGPVQEFSVSRDGSLERVVLAYAVLRPLGGQYVAPLGAKAKGECGEMSVERAVLIVRDTLTINLDYIYGSGPTPPLPPPAWALAGYRSAARRSAWR